MWAIWVQYDHFLHNLQQTLRIPIIFRDYNRIIFDLLCCQKKMKWLQHTRGFQTVFAEWSFADFVMRHLIPFHGLHCAWIWIKVYFSSSVTFWWHFCSQMMSPLCLTDCDFPCAVEHFVSEFHTESEQSSGSLSKKKGHGMICNVLYNCGSPKNLSLFTIPYFIWTFA